MNIYDVEGYSNKIVRALIANVNTDMDPYGQGRVQIYLPDIQSNLEDKYNTYKNSSNKSESAEKDYFPWAVCLLDISTLKEGNEVYVNNVNNDVEQYIIIGIAKSSPVNKKLENNLNIAGNLNGNNVVELAMPNILHEEIGLDYNDYPDNISEDKFGRINGNDNGSLSIGLIQWHDTRAHDCLYNIASNKHDWKDCWITKDLDLYESINNSIETGSNLQYRQHCAGLKITPGTAIYMSIYNMLISNEGKETQLKLASEGTQYNLDYLNENWTINNIAILIMLLDIQNQYGTYVNSVLKGCIDKAEEISQNGIGIMEQLDEFLIYWKGRTTLYIPRRDRTYAYIKELYDQGKLVNQADLTGYYLDENKTGIFAWPIEPPHKVTSARKMRNGRMHYGIDLSAFWVNVYAIADGTCHLRGWPGGGYGNQIMINHHNGYCSLYAHLSEFLVEEGQEVKQGQLIAISGDTGSSGPGSYVAHLHFEISEGETDSISTYYGYRSVDPLQFLANDWASNPDTFVES